jgi:hypothetical protein
VSLHSLAASVEDREPMLCVPFRSVTLVGVLLLLEELLLLELPPEAPALALAPAEALLPPWLELVEPAPLVFPPSLLDPPSLLLHPTFSMTGMSIKAEIS